MRLRYVLTAAIILPVMIQTVRWFAEMIWALARGLGRNCPRCRSTRTRPSRPHLADFLLPAFFLPRRCENCQGRYLELRSVNYVRRARPARSVRPSRPMIPVAAQSGSRR